MDYKVALNGKLASVLERQAQMVEKHEGKQTHEVVKLRMAANQHWQTAYRDWFAVIDPVAILGSKPLLDEKKFLTHQLRVSCQRLIETPQTWRIVSQLTLVLNGIALIAATQPHLFLDGDYMVGTYGPLIGYLANNDRHAAKSCLKYFDEQRMRLLPEGQARRAIHKWLNDERRNLSGKRKFRFPSLVALEQDCLEKDFVAGVIEQPQDVAAEFKIYAARPHKVHTLAGMKRYSAG